MPAQKVGPVVLEVAGDAFLLTAQIGALVWVGTTVAGNQVVLRHRLDNRLLWRGQTDTTNTYLGANIGPKGMTAPNGFYVERIDNGQLLVYLAES
jgi:hypothetical protein